MPATSEVRTLAAALSTALQKPGNAPLFLTRRTKAVRNPKELHAQPYLAISYKSVCAAAAEFAAGLRVYGIARRSCIGIASENRPEWLETDFGCAFGDFMNVGLHLGWPPEKISTIMLSAECQVIVVSVTGAAVIAAALKLQYCPITDDSARRDNEDSEIDISALRTSKKPPLIIVLPPVVGETVKQLASVLRLLPNSITWEDVCSAGRVPNAWTYTGYGFENEFTDSNTSIFESEDNGSDPYTLMFSSGSSGGPPKATVNSKNDWLKSNCSPGAFGNIDNIQDRRGVSYLSLCHGADRGICWQAAFSGGTIGFARGENDLEGCLKDLSELRPTFFLGFAPFWTALYQRHLRKLLPLVDRALQNQLINSIQSSVETDIFPAAKIKLKEDIKQLKSVHPGRWQKLQSLYLATREGGFLERKIVDETRNSLGASLQSAATGGSRTPEPVKRFMYFLLEEGCNGVIDSYGSTEFPGISNNGEIAPDVEVKLIDCHGGYSPKDSPNPRGEILVRRKDGSKTLYWKDPVRTSSVWDEDGWYHTGDVGELNYTQKAIPNRYAPIARAAGHTWTAGTGWLHVIDRVKQVEELYWDHDSLFVATQQLETLYATIPGFEHVVLTTDRNEEGFIAIIVLNVHHKNFEQIFKIDFAGAKQKLDLSQQCKQYLRRHCLRLVRNFAKQNNLAPHEIPVGALVIPSTSEESHPWNAENGFLTITGKVNRVKIKESYHLEWMAQYSNVAADTAAMVADELHDSKYCGCKDEDKTNRRKVPQTNSNKIVDKENKKHLNSLSPVLLQCIQKLEAHLTGTVKNEKYGSASSLPHLIQRANRVLDCRMRRIALNPPEWIESAISQLVPAISGVNDCISISICTVSGERLPLKVKLSDTLLTLKLRIQECHGHPADLQCLIWNGEEIKGDNGKPKGNQNSKGTGQKILKELGFYENCVLNMLLKDRSVEICEEKTADKTLRGRDWLEDRITDDGRYIEKRFELTLCAPPHKIGEKHFKWDSIGSPEAIHSLSSQYDTVRKIALHIRSNNHRWQCELSAAREAAANLVNRRAVEIEESVRRALQHAMDSHSVCPVVFALLRGKRHMQQANYNYELISEPKDMKEAFHELDKSKVTKCMQRVKNYDSFCELLIVETNAIICVAMNSSYQDISTQYVSVYVLTGDETCNSPYIDLLRLRELGDAIDVDTRSLPITWRFSLDWIIDDWRKVREVQECILGCGQNVFVDAQGAHIDAKCDSTGTTSDPVTEQTGVNMGVSMVVKCELTDITIENESNDMTPKIAQAVCPVRRKRYHSVDRGVNRVTWAHEAVEAMWNQLKATKSTAADAELAVIRKEEKLMKLVDPYNQTIGGIGDTWVLDKQCSYWLNEYVQYRSLRADPGTCRFGRNTPASLVRRACDAYGPRLALGVPDMDSMPAELTVGVQSRETWLGILPKAAGIQLVPQNDFLWLRYEDLGYLVKIIAGGLLKMGLSEGSYVALSGYNDFEFAVADFAIASAGMVSVPIHGTYSEDAALHVISKVNCVALCCMRDHCNVTMRHKANRWTVQGLLGSLPTLKHVIIMDARIKEINFEMDNADNNCNSDSGSKNTSSIHCRSIVHESFIDWAHNTSEDSKHNLISLPDPFQARGAPYSMVDEKQESRVTTVLFTSGSSGHPKAVAVGVDEWVTDITFDCPESGVTVSYIPLSHGSDRYKVWSHVVHGARVGFCQFGAENWEWREHNKTDAPGLSAVDLLFEQVRRLMPTAMSCPPNIWAGMHEMFQNGKSLDEISKLLGPRIRTLVTGGAPTPHEIFLFAKKICYTCRAAFSDSYGTTENGALTMNGYQPRSRFKDVEIQLIDSGSFTSTDEPFPRGEVVVRTNTLALGYQGDDSKTRNSFFTVEKKGHEFGCSLDVHPIPKTSGRWYRTGDLGWFDQTGRLVLAGRTSSQSINGCSIDLIENHLENIKGVRNVAIVFDTDLTDTAAGSASQKCSLCVSVIVNTMHNSLLLQKTIIRKLQDFVKIPSMNINVFIDEREIWSIENGLLTTTLKKRRTVAIGDLRKGHLTDGMRVKIQNSQWKDYVPTEVHSSDEQDKLRATVNKLILDGLMNAENAEIINSVISRDQDFLKSSTAAHKRIFRAIEQERAQRIRYYKRFWAQYQIARSSCSTPLDSIVKIVGMPRFKNIPRSRLGSKNVIFKGEKTNNSERVDKINSKEDFGVCDKTQDIQRQETLLPSRALVLTHDLEKLTRERWLTYEQALQIMRAQQHYFGKENKKKTSKAGQKTKPSKVSESMKQNVAPTKGLRGASWAVIVAGGEGFQYGIYNLEEVFQICVQQLGRENVILVAPIKEILEQSQIAASSGLPAFSPTLSLEQNKLKNQQKFLNYKEKFSFILANGGADYDGKDCNAETVLRILEGRPRHKGDKVLPRRADLLHSVFFCFGGHGGSFRSVRRDSPALQKTKCDLCCKPHEQRPRRQSKLMSSPGQWTEWMREDMNCTAQFANTPTHSLENDRVLCVDDEVLTIFGPGRIIQRQALSSLSTTLHGQWPNSHNSIVADAGEYRSSSMLTFGSKLSIGGCIGHRFIYYVKLAIDSVDVQVHGNQNTETTNKYSRRSPNEFYSRGCGLPGGVCWRRLALSYTMSATPQKLMLPMAATTLLDSFLSYDDHETLRVVCTQIAMIQQNKSSGEGPPGCLTLRRDLMVLPFGPRQYNHFHSSLKTREWAFGMPYKAPLHLYGFVSWRHSPITDPTNLLAWQQIFTGLHSIRTAAPKCSILALTEACFSGGAMKFMDDERLNYWNKLESWPVFLMSTAGEAQSSGAGFMQIFMRRVVKAVAALPTRSNWWNAKSCKNLPKLFKTRKTVLSEALKARQCFKKNSGFATLNGSTGPISGTSDVNFSYSQASGIEKADIATWFTQHYVQFNEEEPGIAGTQNMENEGGQS